MLITQAMLAELAGVEQRLEELEEVKANLREQVIGEAKAAVAAGKVDTKGQPVLDVESGALRLKVHLGSRKATADWKIVRAVIEEKNCTYVNGGGKIKQLNDVLDDIVDKSRGRDEKGNILTSDDNRISVKPNIPA